MAKKNDPNSEDAPERIGVSKPESFTHGMIGDLDPHFQLKGSYSDAKNIRLTNAEGDTFTVENIEGNSLFVDLGTEEIQVNAGEGNANSNNDYPTFYDRGPNNGDASTPFTDNLKLDNRASIVGHVSYANQLLLMIVARFEWDRGHDGSTSTPFASEKDRTIFLMVDFDHEMRVQKVSDLRVCYQTSGQQYPDLNMDLDVPVSIEHIVENESISRIYWTDNKNQLRTLNIKQPRLDLLTIESLDITPLMSPSQPVLANTLFGSLPVGVYQYCYKYISENGGESTFSPLSNVYHVSDQSFTSSLSYAGGPKGNLGTQGFQINVKDLDQGFEYIELYSLFYDTKNQAPRVAVVARNQISGTEAVFQHLVWNNEIENGLEEILIESNTFDVCKDIAIKDNILFAANLRQKRNFISEKEWNVKVLRWRIVDGNSTHLDAMLTTNDSQVKHYTTDGNGDPIEINDNTQDYNNHYCGHGQLLGAPDTMYDVDAAAGSSYQYLKYDGSLNNPMWFTSLSSQRSSPGGNGDAYWSKFAYKFLPDRMTLGGESFEYALNPLGGCRVAFGVEEKIADTSQNAWSSPFISSSSKGNEMNTEFGNNGNTVGNTSFRASMNLGGSKDPHLAGNQRGYQRGDIYRFGVQIYDLNGSPGNVLWIGDIETPHQHDVLRMIDIKNVTTASGNDYGPHRPTVTGEYQNLGYSASSLVSQGMFTTLSRIKDHRLSAVYGHTIPPIDVEWFTSRVSASWTNTDAYIVPSGMKMSAISTSRVPGTNTTNYAYQGKVKTLPTYSNAYATGNADDVLTNYDGVHYLYDLYVSFEFLIPDDVCKKISGFRVVRAERTEEDRRIVQQGLLNQTAQYGHAELGLKYGYDTTRFCRKDNEAWDDDPIFVNQWNDQAGALAPTLPEQPEYNVYLNGYLGLAENSHIAFYDINTTDGKATSGNIDDGSIFYWPERGDSKRWGYNGYDHAPHSGNNASVIGGPGTEGYHYRHCAYFGSHDKQDKYTPGTSERSTSASNAGHISSTIFTLDAPDSAFGIRPYVYREGDMLRIDCTMKLTNENRFQDHGASWAGGEPSFGASHNHGITKKYNNTTYGVSGNGITYKWNPTGLDSVNLSGAPIADVEHQPAGTDHTLEEALSFCTRKQIDDDYTVLVGKYYCYDPYFGIGMETDGGKTFGRGNSGSNVQRPYKDYGWQLPISASKEMSEGEIIPNSFFKVSERAKKGMINGFSNNTLGFVKKIVVLSNNYTTEYDNLLDNSGINSWYGFGAVYKTIAFIQDITAGSAQHTDVNTLDYNYDTVSTLQMGLRSILIEVDNTLGARKSGPNADDNFFKNGAEYIEGRRYGSWFAPIDLSSLLEHGDWRGRYDDGALDFWNSRFWNTSQLAGYTGSIAKDTDLGNDVPDVFHMRVNNRSKHLIPFKHLCSIVRKIIPYGGSTKGSIEKTRYIPCGNFHTVTPDNGAYSSQINTRGHVSKVFGGDTFVNLYSHQKTASPYMKKSASRWQVFPVESYVNTDMRSGLTLNAGDTIVGKEMNQPPFSNDWLYNNVYSQENNIKSGLSVDEEKYNDSLNLPYEIAYSNTKILGQTSDAFRRFPINQFHDMEGLYGEINKIVNFKNEIYVLQDNAFAKLLVNPLSMLSDDAGTSLFTGTGETVENHIYISTKYGSRHKFSVAASEKSLYFVDSNFGRLFKYDTEKLISLGDALGQRNYLKYIIKEWDQKPYRECPETSGSGASAGGTHDSASVQHGINYGRLDSVEKPTGSRNYFSDNPLNFLGITSVYDFKNKELLITFHNSAWTSKNHKRPTFARPIDNHSMGNTTDGSVAGISETLVYSEAVNAFISKYSVAPPQWLTGGNGSFLLCPENEINVNSIANFDGETGLAGFRTPFPYNKYGTDDSLDDGVGLQIYRCNPLRLWIWDKHEDKKKTNFFGKKDDVYEKNTDVASDIDNSKSQNAAQIAIEGTEYIADESYIVKVINTEAANAKVFDNSEIIMTPKYINFSALDYTTDITHDTISVKNTAINKTKLIDESEQLVINRRWEFNGSTGAWFITNASNNIEDPAYNSSNEAIDLTLDELKRFRSPNLNNKINLVGKYNNIIRMRVQRTSGIGDFEGGTVRWKGYDFLEKEKGNYTFLGEDDTRSNSTPTITSAGQDNYYLSVEQITDGNFSNQLSDWTLNDPSNKWSSASGSNAATLTNTDATNTDHAQLEQTNIFIIGETYDISFDATVVEGSAKLEKSGGNTLITIDETKTYTLTWVADRTSILFNRAPIEGTVNLSITNISAKQRVYNDYQIIEWDMSNVLNWDESIIEQIRIDLIDSTYFSTYGTNKFDIDWVEIGGLQADKYIDGVLKVPLRTEKSKRRTRGTWAKVKYSARTTDKFNIFAILAKYRKTY